MIHSNLCSIMNVECESPTETFSTKPSALVADMATDKKRVKYNSADFFHHIKES